MNGSDRNNEQAMMAEIGRATVRLVHDFKNQLGGLKLYAAYLKKRFADNPDVAEGLEIADKIIQTIHEMTENATLISKLARPIELRLAEIQFASLVELTINQLQPQIEERRLKVETDLPETDLADASPIPLDSQQMLLALNVLLARAVEVSPESARLRLKLQSRNGGLLFSIFDEGERLTDEQRQSFFAFPTNERMNRNSLNLALAQRIVEAHGGQIAVLAAEPSGSEVRISV